MTTNPNPQPSWPAFVDSILITSKSQRDVEFNRGLMIGAEHGRTYELKRAQGLVRALQQAESDICSEFCGDKHHRNCVAVTLALKSYLGES